VSEHIEVWRSPEQVEGVRVATGFGSIVRSDRVAAALRSCLALGATIVVAVQHEEVVGYATVVPSSALVHERWHDLPSVHELGALEVAAPARRRQLGTAMLGELPRALEADHAIVFARALVGHWDLGRSGLEAMQYRRMLAGMLSRVGFAHERTDDPEVDDHPLSFLTVRYGRHVDVASLYAFSQRLRAS